MKKLKTLISLFLTMFKIGLFTFGGGYAMISIIEREIVEKKKWIDGKEYLDIIAIAESTPGPIAINSATYIGSKIAGFFGSVFATLGVVLPSFIIIYVISFFFEAFLALEWVRYAFNGIQVCVVYLILSAGLKMFRQLKTTIFNVVVFIISLGCLVAFSLFSIKFSSIFYILIGGILSLFLYLIAFMIEKKNKLKNKEKGDE